MKAGIPGALALLVCVVAIAPAWGQVTIPEEYDKTIKSAEVVGALGLDLFGDQTNLYTGATSFTVTDVSLPGNSSLPVAVGRRFVVEDREGLKTPGLFADWELEIPHLHGIFAKKGPSDIGWQVTTYQQPYARCSVSSDLTAAPTDASGPQGGTFGASEFWHGNSLYVPGQGDQEMLAATTGNPNRPTDGKPYHWVTNNQWFFSCLTTTANNVLGEGFLALAPDGTRYWFNWFARRPAKSVTKPVGGGPIDFAAPSTEDASTMVATSAILHREEIWILPTRAEDRFGNSVTYTYDPANPWRLNTISASDGRQLSLTYSGSGRIATVADGTRTWTYTYNPTSGVLEQAILPDTSKWTYSLYGLDSAQVIQQPPGSKGESFLCEAPASAAAQNTYTGTITHPSGAVGTFAFKPVLHGRSYVPKQCMEPGGFLVPADYALYPYYFDTIALRTKTISGPGIAVPYQWSFTYGPPNNSWSQNCASGCATTKTVETVAADGAYTRYTFGNRYKGNEGKLLKVESGTSSTNLLRTETTTYLFDATGQNYPAQVGLSPYWRGDRSAERLTPVSSRTIVQQGRSFVWQVASDCGTGTTFCLDEFARPTKVTKSSASTP